MQNKIFLAKFKTTDQLNLVKKKVKQLFQIAKFDQIVSKFDLTAVKVHFGEKGNSSFVPADYIEPIVRKIKSLGAKPFLSDTNVLYKSNRDNAVNHIALAYEHGFTFEKVGAPVIIADGIAGNNEIEIAINAPMNKKVAIAADFIHSDSIIMVSHATGHIATGLGAAIKNLGMGMSARKGKLIQHTVSKPIISKSKCTACGNCIKWCPEDAIILKADYAEIIDKQCIGCGECLTVCRQDAVKFRWDSSSSELQKQIAEHALGIVKEKAGKIGYLTFLINMTKDCDCMAQEPISIIDDIGVIAGRDPLAIDQALLDLTNNKEGKNLQEKAYPNISYNTQLEYGEKIGLGSREYDLVEI